MMIPTSGREFAELDCPSLAAKGRSVFGLEDFFVIAFGSNGHSFALEKSRADILRCFSVFFSRSGWPLRFLFQIEPQLTDKIQRTRDENHVVGRSFRKSILDRFSGV
jgi:hypothetical protein